MLASWVSRTGEDLRHLCVVSRAPSRWHGSLARVYLYALNHRLVCRGCWTTMRLSLMLQQLFVEHDQYEISFDADELTTLHVIRLLQAARGREEEVLQERELVD